MNHLKILCFILFLVFSSLIVNIFNPEYYNSKFKVNGAYEKFGEDVFSVNKEVLGYVAGVRELETDFFSEKEKNHLGDVRVLFLAGYSLFLITFLSLLFIKKTELSDILFKSGVIGAGFILLLIVLSYINFELLFTFFHQLSFKEGTWLFNANDKIIQIYTFDLFFDLFLRILLTSLALFSFSILFSRVKVKYTC